MNSIFILGLLTLLIFGTALLLWTLKLKLPKWKKVLVLVFLALTLAGLVICCLCCLAVWQPLAVGQALAS